MGTDQKSRQGEGRSMSGGWRGPGRRRKASPQPGPVEPENVGSGELAEGISYSVTRRDGADGIPEVNITYTMTPEAKARLTLSAAYENRGATHPDTLTAAFELAEVLRGQGSAS